MESVKSQGSGLGEYVQFGKWTFQNATDQLKKVTDPEEIRKFKDGLPRACHLPVLRAEWE